MNLIDELGPQVAIIDNNEAEINSIKYLFNEMNIGNTFIEVDNVSPSFPSEPINSVKLVFLDLFYSDFSTDFEPYSCTDWLKAVVPSGAKYILVVWSNDGYRTDELVEVMKETDTPMPYFIETSPKGKYQSGDYEYDIKKLLNDLEYDLNTKFTVSTTEFLGKIIAIEKHSVLINCIINQEASIFEVRRFDKKPFEGYLEPEVGVFLKIKITNRPGSKIYDFFKETDDVADLFKKSDDFSDFEDISFLDDETDEDENNL